MAQALNVTHNTLTSDVSGNFSGLILNIPEGREPLLENAVPNQLFGSSYPEFGNSWNTWWQPEAGNTCSPPAKQPRSRAQNNLHLTHKHTHFSLSNSGEMENRHLSLLGPIAMVINESRTLSLCCWKILMRFPASV